MSSKPTRATKPGQPTKPTSLRAKHAPHAARTPFLLVLGGLIVGGLCALLALNTASAANELRRHDYAAGDQSIGAQVAALENAVARSAAPGNIAAAAARLGMVPAGNPAFLMIRADGGSVTLLGSPAPASGYPTYVPPPTPTAPKTSHTPTPSRTPSSKSTTPAKSSSAKSSTSSPSSSPKSSTRPAPPTPSGITTLPGGDR
jgi:hypothetical protein